MATKATRRERQRQRADARTDAALAITCPACKTEPGVWCGPVLDHFAFRPVEPWMHERRYAASDSAAEHEGD